ncbi:hypothetical protein [Roseomonas marmotae]|uniref:Uncharacterized protein n=1 Tax=Roseomonas marmotae TaxID=2768161 RepID=A0ABS3KFI5_9PROT|nr:hypothetical protein [Roseomonas marmotae]MBO1076239.1 hypothetical protein [Roseomonas marmotae]QTI77877.1 hypothetical protein IAI58_08975 [Roseomonas marmotae]
MRILPTLAVLTASIGLAACSVNTAPPTVVSAPAPTPQPTTVMTTPAPMTTGPSVTVRP